MFRNNTYLLGDLSPNQFTFGKHYESTHGLDFTVSILQNYNNMIH